MKSLGFVLLSLVACSTSDPRAPRTFCTERVVGDPSAPIELEIVSRDADGRLRPVTESAPLVGRHGLELAVRARNLDGCAVAVTIENLDTRARGGAMVELDAAGDVDPDNPLHVIELPQPRGGDVINAVVQDATGHWAATRWSP